MSYQERAYFTHNTLGYTDGIRISLLQKDYNGTSRELRTDANPFEFEFDEQPSLTEWFMPSALTAYFRIDSQQLLDDLVSAQEEEFILEYKIGLTVYWRGFVRNGLIQAQETTLPITVSITAIDGITLLKNRFLSKTAPEQTTIKAILDSLLGGYELAADGWDSLELRQLSSDASKSIFELANVNRSVFYEGDDQDQQPVSQYFFLEQILKRFCARLYYYNGWKIETLDSEKSWITTKTVTPKSFLKDLISTYLPARKTLQLAYKHNAGNKLFSVEAGTVYDANGYSQTISYSPTGDDKLTIDGYVSTQQDQFTAYSDENQFYFDIALTTGTHYWDRATRRWRAGNNANSISIFDPPRVGSSPIFGRYRLEVDSPPTGTTQLTLSISSIIRRSPANTAASVNYNFSVAYNAGSVVQGDTQVLYAQNEDQAFESFDLGELLIGDGLGVQTAGAITYSNGDPTRNWRNAKSDASPSFYEPLNKLNLRTILGYQKSPRKVLRGTLAVKDYHPYQLISYEDKLYRFSGGNLTGEGRWQGTWIELRYEAPDVTFTEYAEDIPDFNTLNFSDNSQTLLEVKEVLGSVTVTDIQTDLLVEWENIQVILKDGTRFAVEDGVFEYQPDTPQEMVNPPVRVFYYDKPNNAIVQKTYDEWINSDEFFDSINYAELFRLTRNKLTSPDDAAPKTDVDVAPIAKKIFADSKASETANVDELITAFKKSILGIVGSDISAEVSSIPLDAYTPLRIDLPESSRITLISGKEWYDLELSAKVNSGSTSISIKPQYIECYEGAKLILDDAQVQSQIQVSPRKVKIIAENAATNASAALTLATTANTAVAGLQAQIDGIDLSGIATIEASVSDLEDDIGTIQATTIMKASVGANNVASISVEAISGANPTSGIKIAGANIDLAGLLTIWNADNTSATEIDGNRLKTGTVLVDKLDAGVVNATAAVVVNNTSFIADVANAVSGTTFSGVTVYKGATQPTGGTYLQGDIWLDTTQVNGVPRNLPHVYDGSNWIRQFAILTDGDFQVGTINANKIAGDDLSSIRSTTGFLTVNDRIIVGSGGFIRGNSYSPASVGIAGSAGFYLGSDAAGGNTYKFAVGNGAKYLYYDGTDVKFKGGVIEGVASAETKLDGDINMLNTSKIYIGSDLEISKDRIMYKDTEMSALGLRFGNSTIGYSTRFDAVGKIILDTWTELNKGGVLQLGTGSANIGLLSMIGSVFTFSNRVSAPTLTLYSLPTSATGLSTGMVWNDNGTLKIAS